MDSQGRLILCQHGDRRVARLEQDGKFTTLADRYMGKRFNSPNDGVFKSNGDLYFTDPPYGLLGLNKDPAKELDFNGVYRISAERRHGYADHQGDDLPQRDRPFARREDALRGQFRPAQGHLDGVSGQGRRHARAGPGVCGRDDLGAQPRKGRRTA